MSDKNFFDEIIDKANETLRNLNEEIEKFKKSEIRDRALYLERIAIVAQTFAEFVNRHSSDQDSSQSSRFDDSKDPNSTHNKYKDLEGGFEEGDFDIS